MLEMPYEPTPQLPDPRRLRFALELCNKERQRNKGEKGPLTNRRHNSQRMVLALTSIVKKKLSCDSVSTDKCTADMTTIL
ncbi:hypothetical protein H5410_020683 [Solanum commersonii]|uniref:Uncharacterized protein n=1 Tax=Solanum commersonii TaxID=4109 RepID=A0A9J5Z9T0_SOLCO|nr:hypothetical protein H5410_020683 [Solanum commersonii]